MLKCVKLWCSWINSLFSCTLIYFLLNNIPKWNELTLIQVPKKSLFILLCFLAIFLFYHIQIQGNAKNNWMELNFLSVERRRLASRSCCALYITWMNTTHAEKLCNFCIYASYEKHAKFIQWTQHYYEAAISQNILNF